MRINLEIQIQIQILDHFCLRLWPWRRFMLSEHSLVFHITLNFWYIENVVEVYAVCDICYNCFCLMLILELAVDGVDALAFLEGNSHSVNVHCELKKTGPFFHLNITLANTCPILIILPLLQTEINCDKIYHKIYHHTSNLLVHYLVKWTRMYWPTLLAWFRN